MAMCNAYICSVSCDTLFVSDMLEHFVPLDAKLFIVLYSFIYSMSLLVVYSHLQICILWM